MNRFFWLILFITFAFVCHLQAQNVRSPELIREEVRNLFDKKIRNVWIILSSGKLDDMHVVDMAFGSDGKHIKGFYYLRSSGERFEIDGSEKDNRYVLIETNKRGKTTGYILGEFDGNHFSGQWLGPDKKQSLSLETSVLTSFDQYQPVLCDHKLWHSYYTGKIGKTPSSVFLCKSEHQLGFCCKKEDSLVFHKESGPENKPVFIFRISQTQRAIVDLDSPEYIVVEDVEGYQNYLLKVSAMVPFQCFEFANFTTRIETVRPVLDNKKFNQWLDNTFHYWFEHGNKKITLVTQESYNNAERYKDIGYGWVELSYLSDEFISGHVFMQSSWKKGTDKISFIFDLKKSKLMHNPDIWEETLLTPQAVDSMIQEKKISLSCPEEKIKTWLSQQSFQHITLKENGLSFQTPFSNVYGEYEVLIPYIELKPYLKNKSFLKSF